MTDLSNPGSTEPRTGADWHCWIGKPDSEWPEDARTARLLEQMAKQRAPTLESLPKADADHAISLIAARIADHIWKEQTEGNQNG